MPKHVTTYDELYGGLTLAIIALNSKPNFGVPALGERETSYKLLSRLDVLVQQSKKGRGQ
jgi:hypothetical protein